MFTQAEATPKWWEIEPGAEDQDDAAQRLFNEVRYIENDQCDMRERMLKFMRLYDPYSQISGAEIDVRTLMGEGTVGAPSMNICKSVVDTLTSMIAKNRPRATFMTDGSDFSTERQAKLMEKFAEGEFQRLDVYAKATRVFKDAAISGIGYLIGDIDDDEVCLDRGLWDEAIVDEADGRYGEPLIFRRRRFVRRDALIALYPDDEEAIKSAQSNDEDLLWTNYRRLNKDELVLIEAWKRGPDGRYILAISNKVLEYKKFEKKKFPIVFFKYDEKVTGFWGTGIIQEIAGVQNRLNRINWVITRVQDLHGIHRVVMHRSDANNASKFDNRPDAIWFYNDRPPEFLAPQVVPPELYVERDRLIGYAHQLAGVSELSSQSKKPADLESAVALREFNDIESMRFSIQAQRYEQFHLDIARLIIELHKDLQGSGGKAKTTWQTKNLAKQIDFSEVEMDEALYAMSIEASSMLPRTPAGRIQTAIELSQAGLISPDEARRLMDHPDLQRVLDLENAAIEDAERVVELLSNGDYEPPEHTQNLALCSQIITQSFLRIKAKNAPESILDGFRRWLAQATMLESGGGAPQGMSVPPGATGAPPPQGPPGLSPPISLPPPGQQIQIPGAASPMGPGGAVT